MQGDLTNLRPSYPGVSMHLASKFKEECLKLFLTYGRKLEVTAEIWSKRLLDADVTLGEIKKAVDQTVLTCDRMPSLSEFLTILRKTTPRETREETESKKLIEQSNEMLEWSKGQKAKFIESIGEDATFKALKKYCNGVFSFNEESYGITYEFFYPIFFKDIVRSKGNLDEAIVLGKRELENLPN